MLNNVVTCAGLLPLFVTLFFHTSSCQMLSQVTFAVNSVPEEEDVPPLSHRESSVQSWCVGVKRE